MAWKTSAASSTVLAIGPTVSMDHAIGNAPRRLTRPHVGRRPTMPHQADGLRMDPAVSPPRAAAQSEAATATPVQAFYKGSHEARRMVMGQ